MKMIEIQDLSFAYQQGELVLDQLSLEIEKGSIFGLVGKNGAGKTTFFQLLLGILKPDGGAIQIGGLDGGRKETLPRGKIGFVSEQPYYHKNFRLREYLVDLNGLAQNPKSAHEINQLIRFVHLQDVSEEYIKNFSKGMLQRLGIAQALLNDPELLILDEPMSGLDVVGQELMRELILRIHHQGTTVLFSSHNLYELERISSQIGLLHEGRLELMNQGDLQKEKRMFLQVKGLNYNIWQEFTQTEEVEFRDGELTFPAEDQELYFQIIEFLTQKRLQISKLILQGPSLERLILNYLAEDGEVQ